MIFIYGAIVHVLAWFLMAKLMPYISIALVGLIMCLEPIVVFWVDMTYLGKSVTFWQMIGAILTLIAIYLGARNRQKN
ncbi:MAG: EamA family transporter [Ostreibacterium sp.]